MCSLLLTVMFHFLKTHFCFHTDEPPYWYWEVTVILKKMMLTGAMTIVAPGSSAQVVIALLIVMVNMLLVLKLAPFLDDADDWLAFLTSVQMMLTLLGGLLLMTDNPTDPTYDPNFMGVTLVVINAFGFVALMFGLMALHPAIRRRINKFGAPKKEEPEKGGGGGSSDTGSSTKIVPVKNTEEEEGTTTIDVKENDQSNTKESIATPAPPTSAPPSSGETSTDETSTGQKSFCPSFDSAEDNSMETNPTEKQVTTTAEANDPAESVTSADVTEK